MNRQIVTSILIIILALTAITGGTLAWFTAEAEIPQNIFDAGTVVIEAGETGNYTGTTTNWNPGDQDEKNVWVEIKGSKTIYLRAAITESWQFNEDHYNNYAPDYGDWDSQELKLTFDRGADYNNDPLLNNVPNKVEWFYKDGDEELQPWPHNHWQYLGGFWYYIGPDDGVLNNEELTFLSAVGLKGAETGNEYQGATYTIDIRFEAIQTTHGAKHDAWGVKWDDEENQFKSLP